MPAVIRAATEVSEVLRQKGIISGYFQFFVYAAAFGELRVVADHNNAGFFFQKGMLIFGVLSVNQKKNRRLAPGFRTY